MKKFLYSLCFLIASFNARASVTDSSFTETTVILETTTGKISGSLTIPVHFKEGPVVLIIAGSGPTDRNGNNPMMKNNSLQQLAFGLANKGIASLRFDKRGVAESATALKKESELRFDDFIADVRGWIELLKSDKRFTEIIIAGHSEGSLIGMIAAQKDCSRFISIAGAGEPANITIRKQLASQPSQVTDIAYPVLDSIAAGHLVAEVRPMLSSLFRPSVQPYLISWFKYNPKTEIKKLNIPVLIIQGTTDIQVSVDDAKNLHSAKPRCKTADH
jgi:pimeloyl-ACP methyl ester carboxylesterase